MLFATIAVLGAYFIGSVSSAILVCRLWGVDDPREVGSGNPGATNVMRHAGKLAALLTLVGDAAKGFIPVLIGRGFGLEIEIVACVGLAAFLGHLFPIFFAFKGGKGVATFIGVNLALAWWLGLSFIVIWLAMAASFRYSSLAALTASMALPFIAFYTALPLGVVVCLVAMVILVFVRHRSNIEKLCAGEEKRIGATKAAP
ncbi:MAG: glycerol-3-phosphate 1-O-acyltransferase PlsY [Pseudomonadota bacterium]